MSESFAELSPYDSKSKSKASDTISTKTLESIGYSGDEKRDGLDDPFLNAFVNLKLAAVGAAPVSSKAKTQNFLSLVDPILKSYQEQQHLLIEHGGALCPADQRVQNFLASYLSDTGEPVPTIPSRQLKLDRHGLAKLLSLPIGEDLFQNEIITSYRVAQGILHNPKNDKRTTEGVFHVVDGGLPVSADKKVVPKIAFQRLLQAALNPPAELLTLPFTANQEAKAKLFVSLLLRPVVSPEVDGFIEEKRHEVRFLAPGSMVCNLDFVESIFGNAENPDLAENDAALDPEHWTGTTGLVILAPQLIKTKKKALGLPHISEATDRQKRDGMCYTDENELYNGGSAFKVVARDARGVVVTIIADNYFGYCKKEVKTQLGMAANLYGQTEEEHAGGCVSFPSFDLGLEASVPALLMDPEGKATLQSVLHLIGDAVDVKAEGYAVDKDYSDVIYVPENAAFSIPKQSITWDKEGKKQSLGLKPGTTYILPNGYKIEMVKKGSNSAVKEKAGASGGDSRLTTWRLKGTLAEGVHCHKPATVSGGGKSEISKRVDDMITYGPVFVANINEDFDLVQKIVERDYTNVLKNPDDETYGDHPIKKPGVLWWHSKKAAAAAAATPGDLSNVLDKSVSLGIVELLLHPSDSYSDEHNAFIKSIPPHVKELVYVLKQHYDPSWGKDWRSHFHTDAINGALGHELKFHGQPLIASYMRVGFRSKYDEDIPLAEGEDAEAAWKIFSLRQDFFPSEKLQTEDDITASVVVPSKALKGLEPGLSNPSLKFVRNCEYRLFQRPDEAIHRGFDKTTELDMSKSGNFISNFEPLTREQVRAIVDDTIGFQKFTAPMQTLLLDFLASDKPTFCVSSAHPRIVAGKPSKNPRYLQDAQDLTNPRAYYLGVMGARLARKLPLGDPVHFPVTAVLCGRRNNVPEPHSKPPIPALAVHNPIHYFELPELFMELTSSMTGKSPSTTGAGSEGALTKGPFNMLSMIHDLNNAFVSLALCNYHVFISSAGVIGPHHQVDHDFSLLVPEVWGRMRREEQDANYLIQHGYLEKVPDLQVEGKPVPSSLLGYRITAKFATRFFGRVFGNPSAVLPETILRPEIQDLKIFAEGVETIVSTNRRVAQAYIDDGSAEMACPPLKALLYIMAKGSYEGLTISDPNFRALFSRDAVVKSDWYKQRLVSFRDREAERLARSVASIEKYLVKTQRAGNWKGQEIAKQLKLEERLTAAKEKLKRTQTPEYLASLEGSMGVDPALYTCKGNNYVAA